MHVAAGDKKGKEKHKTDESSVNKELRTSKIQKRNCYPLRGEQGSELRRKSGHCGLCGIKMALVNLHKVCPFFKWVIIASNLGATLGTVAPRDQVSVHEDLEKPRNLKKKNHNLCN